MDGNHPRGSTWAQFWNRYVPYLVGGDFMQILIGIMGKIVNPFVFGAFDHDTQRVHLFEVTLHPTDEGIFNGLPNATDDSSPTIRPRRCYGLVCGGPVAHAKDV